MRIGIDCDGVLRSFIESVKRVVKDKHPEHADQLNIIPEGWNFNGWLQFWSEDDAEDFIFNKHYEDIFANASPFQEATEDWPLLKEWAKENGHELVMVSAQRRNTINPTTLWIAKNNFDFKEIHFTHDKWKVDVDVLVDDSPTKLKKFKKKSIVGGVPICMKRNWNTKCQTEYICIDRLSDIMSLTFG